MQRARQPTLRAFLALEFDDEALRAFAAHLRRLRTMQWANDVRWVSVDNLHLTLRFLGDVTVTQATRYADALRAGLVHIANLPQLTLMATPPRFFPKLSRPRVIACLIEPNATLTELAALAEACAIGIGLAREARPFNGHITLGRLRESFPRDAGLSSEDATMTRMRPTAITLYRSDLQPSGAIYAALYTFSLGSHV